MYFTGVLGPAPTLAQLHADLIAILTGSATSQAGLTAFSASSFVNTVPPGWTVHDNAAGALTNGVVAKVIKAPLSDDGTKFKYVELDTLTASILYFNGYETWDAIGHTGTNPIQVTPVNNSFQAFSLIANQQITIVATANGFYIQGSTNLLSAATQWQLFAEFTRDDPWNTVSNGYPSWLQSGGYNSVASYINGGQCRAFNPATGNDAVSFKHSASTLNDSVNSAGCSIVPNGCTLNPALMGTYWYTTMGAHLGVTGVGGMNHMFPHTATTSIGADSAKSAAKYLYELSLRQITPGNSYTTGVFLGGNISAKFPQIFFVPHMAGAVGDSLYVGASEYLLAGNYKDGYVRLALKKE